MPLVKYVSNKSVQDGTGAIKLASERFLYLGGSPLEITDEEMALLSSDYVIESIEEASDEAEKVTPVADVRQPVQPSAPVPAAPTTTAPTVSVGSTPSPTQSLPTPSAGN